MKKEVAVKTAVKAEPVKAEVKVEAAKVAEKKETPKVEVKVEKKEEPAKKEAVKEVEKKAPARKTATKTAEKKAPAKKPATKTAAKPATKTTAKAAMDTQVFIQTSYCEIVTKDVINKCVEAYKNEGNKAKVSNINVYIKPEENAAYYVINEKTAGRVDIF